MIARAWLVVLTLAACGGAPPAAAPVPSAEPGIAPRPFTAEQIRAAMPVGHEIRYQLEVTGAPRLDIEWRVVAADEQGVTIEDLGTPGKKETTSWVELMKHASFPADRTTRREGTIEVPAGRFETLEYVVRLEDGVKTLHFAKSLPGPPVLVVEESGGQVKLRMTLLSRK